MSGKIILYWHTSSGFSRVVHYLLKANKLDFEEKLIDLMKAEQKSPEYTKVNPFQKIPCIQHDDFSLMESSVSQYILQSL